MNDMNRIRVDKLRLAMDKVDRLKRLQGNEDYQLLLEIMQKDRDNFIRTLTRPKIIGSVKEVVKSDKSVELIKYTAEDDREYLKETQYRYDTYNKILNIIPGMIADAEKRIKPELDKLLSEQIA